jgi:hypothetical protein
MSSSSTISGATSEPNGSCVIANDSAFEASS